MKKIYIWDPVVRLFHWGTVAIVILNLTLFEEGKIHNNLGYVLAGLIAVRLIWGVIGSRHARFSNFIPSYQALQAYLNIGPQVDRAKKEEQHGHNPLGALMIVNLLVTLTAIILTGHLMTTLTFFGSEFLEELHEVLTNWLIFSVVLHVGAVLFESFRTNVNLISAMITGYKVFWWDEKD